MALACNPESNRNTTSPLIETLRFLLGPRALHFMNGCVLGLLGCSSADHSLGCLSGPPWPITLEYGHVQLSNCPQILVTLRLHMNLKKNPLFFSRFSPTIFKHIQKNIPKNLSWQVPDAELRQEGVEATAEAPKEGHAPGDCSAVEPYKNLWGKP